MRRCSTAAPMATQTSWARFVDAAHAAGEPVLAVLPAARLATAQRACGDHAGSGALGVDGRGRPQPELPALGLRRLDRRAPRTGADPRRAGLARTGPRRSDRVPASRGARQPRALGRRRSPCCARTTPAASTPRSSPGPQMTHPRPGRRRRPAPPQPDATASRWTWPTGEHWPLAEPVEPVSEHAFAGDLGSLRRSVAGDPHAVALGRRLADLVFAVSEAASNALKHADGTCTTRLWRDGGRRGR